MNVFVQGNVFTVGRHRLQTGMLAVPLSCRGFSHSRGSYVMTRNFVVCVCLSHEAWRTSPIWGCHSGVVGDSGLVGCVHCFD